MSWDDKNVGAVRSRCEVCKKDAFYSSQRTICASCYYWVGRVMSWARQRTAVPAADAARGTA